MEELHAAVVKAVEECTTVVVVAVREPSGAVVVAVEECRTVVVEVA